MVSSKAPVVKTRVEQDAVAKAARDAGQQHPAPVLESPKIKNPNKRRRKEETAPAQDSIFSSLPPTKKSKSNTARAVPVEKIATPADTGTAPGSELPKQRSEEDSSIAPDLLARLYAYEVGNMNIISSSQIQVKVAKILETLASFSFVAPVKPSIVRVHAKGPVASKLITIVEIAKREIARAGGKWYQYNGLEEFIAMKAEKPAATNGTGRRLADEVGKLPDGADLEGDCIRPAFETMKTPLERAIDGKPKIKAIAVLTTYLSRVQIGILKEKYGEQTNAMT